MKTQFATVTQSDFCPPSWAKNRHVQTILARYGVKPPIIKWREERLKTEDNDILDLAWGEPVAQPKGLVVLFHGLEGSKNSHYIAHMVKHLSEAGLQCVLMHFRGCSGEPNLTTRAYHSGATFDPHWLLPQLKQRYPDIPLYAVGFSLGGNMLAKLNGELKANNPIDRSVVISAPLRLEQCAEAIKHGFSKVYERKLLNSMRNNLLKKSKVVDFANKIRVSETHLKHLTSFTLFDENVTAPLHGFAGAQDYYEKCSAMPYLKFVKRPMLVIHAKDDPFMNDNVIPQKPDLSPFVAYELSQRGGHVGFVQGQPWAMRADYLAKRTLSFFVETFDEIGPNRTDEKDRISTQVGQQ